MPGYQADLARFERLNTQVVGVSVDHVPALKAWAESLGGITFPLLSDFWPHGEAARAWDVLREDEGLTERAIFVIDSTGVVRYADVHDIDEQPSNDELFAVLEEIEPELALALRVTEAAEEGPGAGAERPTERELVMYCTPWCPDCRQAREWLDTHGVSYREVDVSRDPDARTRAASHNEGRLHTPTFELGDEVCVDFEPDRLSELLQVERGAGR